MSTVLLSGPLVEPVSLAEIKAWLRLDGTDEDGLLTALVTSARLSLETATGKAFITQSWRLVLDDWPDEPFITSPLAPLQSLTAGRVYTADGSATALNVADFIVEKYARQLPRLAMLKRPVSPLRPMSGIELDLVAGFGDDATRVPEPLKLAIKILVAFWFENRGDDGTGITLRWPEEIARLLVPYQTRRL